MTRAIAFFALALALTAGCGGTGPTCGAGTHLEGGACVPDQTSAACGAGTVLVGGVCEPVAADAGGDAGAPDDAGADAGTTDAGDVAADVSPVCVPSCQGRDCGSDGCNGTCGTCSSPAKPYCDDSSGQCVAKCVPSCVGRDCGDDGCGGTCGTCAGGTACTTVGRCVPPGWTCAALAYNAGIDPCDCGCGAPDPDCKNPKNPVAGCSAVETCDATGKCVSKAPASWTCSVAKYHGLDTCDCGCGAHDPDCDLGLPLAGCAAFQTCSANDTCVACTPNCAGKTCGDDGCGGTCGTCSNPAAPTCHAGQCVNACSPTPILCSINTCGDDGCGGSCGTCAAGSQCQNGQCSAVILPEAPTSCAGHCGSIAPSGCYCAAACVAAGTCCSDYKAQCGCQPKCAGKQCGEDGCGGSCGTCPANAAYCTANGTCTASCTPDCKGKDCGDDGCGGSCGTCAGGSACAFTQKCVPAAWTCSTVYFGDGAVCDCGCGASDPDCTDPKHPVYGCPGANDTCGAGGICNVKFCAKDATCGLQWCTGVYAAGGGAYKGVCATPDPLATPAGQPCFANSDCASSACIDGLCAQYCVADSDCAPTQRCLGAPVAASGTGVVAGFAGTCQSFAGSGTPCTSQAGCAKGEVCGAFIDPASFSPRYLCTTGSAAGGSSCLPGTACGGGKYCAPKGNGGVCTLTCPGGASDCPGQTTCQQVPFFPSKIPALSGEPKVALCVPN